MRSISRRRTITVGAARRRDRPRRCGVRWRPGGPRRREPRCKHDDDAPCHEPDREPDGLFGGRCVRAVHARPRPSELPRPECARRLSDQPEGGQSEIDDVSARERGVSAPGAERRPANRRRERRGAETRVASIGVHAFARRSELPRPNVGSQRRLLAAYRWRGGESELAGLQGRDAGVPVDFQRGGSDSLIRASFCRHVAALFRHTLRRRAAVAISVIAAGTLLAACTNGPSVPGVASIGSSSTSPHAKTTIAKYPHNGLGLALCMRARTASRTFPNRRRRVGSRSLSSGDRSDLDPASPRFQAAFSACRSVIGITPPTPAQQAAQLAQALKFAKCMRAHGVTNFPDPGSGGGLQFNSSSGLNPNDPVFQSASKTCSSGGRGPIVHRR